MKRWYPNAWKIALNTPEFLVHFNLRQMLAEAERSSHTMAFRFRSMIMTGNDSIPLSNITSLLKQRSQYACRTEEEWHGITVYSRYLHRYQYGKYKVGRHEIERSWQWAPLGFLVKYQYTPWPDIIKRKLQIRQRMPTKDFVPGIGYHHNVGLSQLEKNKDSYRKISQNDFRSFASATDELNMAHRLWREILDY